MSEIRELIKQKNIENKKYLEKRNMDTGYCGTELNLGKVELVNKYNGYPIFRSSSSINSEVTAIVRSDGCSIPFGLGDYYNESSRFVPACNSHDVCYGCQVGKWECDYRLLKNTSSICYDTHYWWQVVSISECQKFAYIIYLGLTAGGWGSYNNASDKFYNLSENCAYCGGVDVKDYLLQKPFYYQNTKGEIIGVNTNKYSD